jgi:hypothetical protein
MIHVIIQLGMHFDLASTLCLEAPAVSLARMTSRKHTLILGGPPKLSEGVEILPAQGIKIN